MKHLIDKNGNIIKSEGTSQPNSSEFTYALGWRDEIFPEYDSDIYILGERYFAPELDKVTWTLIHKILPSVKEIQAAKISTLKINSKELLSKTDWTIIRKYEREINVPIEIETERQRIIDVCNQKEQEILSMTDQVNLIKFDVTI